jgi:serine-type D-Ala-D-Ala carboxypeptidase/endopeptidase (penicillin-binding protein 4)
MPSRARSSTPTARPPPAARQRHEGPHRALRAGNARPRFRFTTRLVATGPVRNGRLDGDLILAGSGDPTLDTDALGQLAADLKAAGIREVAGALRIDDGGAAALPWIDPDQPDHVGYNPTVGRPEPQLQPRPFRMEARRGRLQVTMEARAARSAPGWRWPAWTSPSAACPSSPTRLRDGIERWTVARGALGDGGSRWLPVRRPSDYAAEVFRTLARSARHRPAPRPPVRGRVAP